MGVQMPESKPGDALEPFDLVAISSFTAQIDEAYALADRYRAAGVPVVLGGLHVTLMPDEAAEHADSIVLNGAEGAWPRLVEDFRHGRLQPRNMTIGELESGLRWLFREVYNDVEVARRQRHYMELVKRRPEGAPSGVIKQ